MTTLATANTIHDDTGNETDGEGRQLKSYILNAGTHTCTPYVSVRLVPDVKGSRFENNRQIAKVKTRAVDRTLFPL